MPTYSGKFRELINDTSPVWTLVAPGDSWQYHASALAWMEALSCEAFADAAESVFAVIFVYIEHVVLWIGWTEGFTESWNWCHETEAVEGPAQTDLTGILEEVAALNSEDFVGIDQALLKQGMLNQVQERINECRMRAGLEVKDGSEAGVS